MKSLYFIIGLTLSSLSSYGLTLPLDLIILFDSSGSIDNADYGTQLDSIQQIIDDLPVNGTEVNVSLVNFSTNVTTALGLSSDTGSITSALTNSTQQSGQTNYADAFDAAYAELNNSSRFGSTAGIVLLITDGEANEPNAGNPFIEAFNASNTLKGDGFTIMGVAIGGDVDSSYLGNFASSPTNDNVFSYADFDGFKTSTGEVSAAILAAIVPEPSALAFTILPLAALLVANSRRRTRK